MIDKLLVRHFNINNLVILLIEAKLCFLWYIILFVSLGISTSHPKRVALLRVHTEIAPEKFNCEIRPPGPPTPTKIILEVGVVLV